MWIESSISDHVVSLPSLVESFYAMKMPKMKKFRKIVKENYTFDLKYGRLAIYCSVISSLAFSKSNDRVR